MPIRTEITVATSPISSEMRAPWKIWAAMSRPGIVGAEREARIAERPDQRARRPAPADRAGKSQSALRGHGEDEQQQDQADHGRRAAEVELQRRTSAQLPVVMRGSSRA